MSRDNIPLSEDITLEKLTSSEILQALGPGVSVVTANNRLASVLRNLCEQRWLRAGEKVWPTPLIQPWNIWIRNVLTDSMLTTVGFDNRLLLNSEQERRLWVDIIIASEEGSHPLQQVAGMVMRAMEAWQYIHAWQLPLDTTTFNYNRDSQAFLQWSTEFVAECSRRQWISLPVALNQLARSLPAGNHRLPAELLIAGFDELTPQQTAIIQTLEHTGCTVRRVQSARQNSSPVRLQCLDARNEALRVALWARDRLEASSDSQIGIVVPELAEHRQMMTRTLDTVLLPAAQLPGRQDKPRPYNVSLGLPLDGYPVIATAWILLGLSPGAIPLQAISQLLRSPFIFGWNEEASSRAALDSKLRDSSEPCLSLKQLRYQALRLDNACPLFIEKFSACLAHIRDMPEAGRPSEWLQQFTHALKAAGWGQGRTLSSTEYQTVEAWNELLSQFAALELVSKPVSRTEALTSLRNMAAERLFQPQTDNTRIQVLGILEATGLQFDHLWVMGLHDGVWPLSPKPNPFIPLPMQRQAGLPHADAERELRVSRAVTQRLLNSAGEVIVSYPARQGDTVLRPSPLIKTVVETDWQALNVNQYELWRDRVQASCTLTHLEEDSTPPLEAIDSRGGSQVFKLQAQCPFHAFAEIRLGARGFAETEIGLNAMTRGSSLHRVLERVWNKLQSHQQLISTPANELRELIGSCVDAVLAEIAVEHPYTLKGQLHQLESLRLHQQVTQWLEVEKQRLPFTLEDNEVRHSVSAGGVRVNLTIDRLDRLENGQFVIIDYKTGTVTPSGWFDERPDEPQLPLYSIAVCNEDAQRDIAGVLFAIIRAGKLEFKGVLETPGIVPNVKTYDKLSRARQFNSWQDILTHWRTTMEALGREFSSGHAAVTPKESACTWCELQPLCRIYEIDARRGYAEDV